MYGCGRWVNFLAFGSLLVIRNFMGYLPLLDNILILLILALVASFLPLNGMVLICFVVILGELYGLSLPSLAVGGGLLLLVALLYFRLQPQEPWLLLTPSPWFFMFRWQFRWPSVFWERRFLPSVSLPEP